MLNRSLNCNLFVVEIQSDIELILEIHDHFKVYNVGRSSVAVYLKYGKDDIKENTEVFVAPGHAIIFNNIGKLFRVSGIRIRNYSKTRAIVYCSNIAQELPSQYVTPPLLKIFNRSYHRYLKETYYLGVEFVPYLNEKFKALIETFWPSEKTSKWQEIVMKLEPVLEENKFQVLSNIITDIFNIGVSMKKFVQMFETGNNRETYMEIAEHLSDFESNIISRSVKYNNTDMLSLPLYSNFLLMKTIFYKLGVLNSSDIGLVYSDVQHLENQHKQTIISATKIVDDIYADCLEDAYNNSAPKDLYENMMNVRTYVGIHGLEFSRIWNSIFKNPYTENKLYNDVIVYSNLFGRVTPNSIRQAVCEMYPPFTPRYIGFIHNYLVLIEIYLWKSATLSRIGGMRLVFSDHSSYVMGTKSNEVENMDLSGTYISKMKVTGDGAVDSCSFFLGDGKEFHFGTETDGTETESFELKNHRIVSLFLSSDSVDLQGQAANIAVSYRLNSEWE